MNKSVFTVLASMALTCSPMLAQSASPADSGGAKGSWTVPRLSDGHPDLQGIWTNKTITPMERPKEFADEAFFTPEEAKAYTEMARKRNNKDQRGGGVRDVLNAYNDFWWDSGTKLLSNMRTSIVTDPPDGRIPPLTAKRKAQLEEQAEAVKIRCQKPGCSIANNGQLSPADKPEDLDLMTRCISFGTVVPMLPSAYNNNYQIVQAPGMVAIDTEMVHDVRRIPTDGSPHLPAGVREWTGDPRGHWEGDTLVVDSRNFQGETRLRGADDNLHLIEKFTRTGPDTLLYQFTVDDPTAFTKPWSGEIPLSAEQGPLYEYACHEGNIGMKDIIVAAKAAEAKAAEQSGAQKPK